MSFQNNCMAMPIGSVSVPYGDTAYDSSTRTEKKRAQPWFMDASAEELSSNKKQAIESLQETSGAANMNNYLFGDRSISRTRGQIDDSLMSAKPFWNSNESDHSVQSIISSNPHLDMKDVEAQYGNDMSISLSMPQAVGDPLCLNTGLPRMKINDLGISENFLSEFLGNSSHAEANKLASTTSQRVGHDIFAGPTNNATNGNALSMATAFRNIDKNFISVGQASGMRDDNRVQYFDRIDSNMLAVGQSFNRGNNHINTMLQTCENQNGSIMSFGNGNNSMGNENLFQVNPFYNNLKRSAGSTYSKENTDAISTTTIRGQQDATVAAVGTVYNKEFSSILPMGQNCKKGEQTTISFGGFQNNPEESVTSASLSNILQNQSSAQSLGILGLQNAVQELGANVVSAATSSIGATNKNQEQRITKKVSSNNFPTNVKSLLSTGILDGVPVKYVSWAREKNLRGVVRGTGYLCGCKECNLAKIINAYEFERHAGCKTKHPNNHIYFENGKTIYAAVQELKSTPQDMLFEVIKNVAGSPVNQKNFHIWKASYQAATRELQRIYGSDELIVSS